MGTQKKDRPWVPSPAQAAVLEAALELELCEPDGQRYLGKRTVTAICGHAKVSRGSFYNWMNNDPSFHQAWKTVWEKAIDRHFAAVAATMIDRALDGDVGAGRLCAELKGALRQRVEITGKDGGPVRTLDLSRATPAQLEALMSLAPSVVAPVESGTGSETAEAAATSPAEPAATEPPNGDPDQR